MAQSFRISVNLSELLSVGPIIRAQLYANLSQQIAATTTAGVERWKEAIDRAPLWIGEKEAYKASIQATQITAYSWEISSDYKYVEDIETGRPPYDLKRMLGTSMKVRVSKRGMRYLIIPFRHNTPGNTAHAPAMPSNVYAEARQLAPSKINGVGDRASGTGAFDREMRTPFLVPKRRYQWGDRLAPGMAPKLKDHHKSDPYAGMVRMDTTLQGRRSSAYLTFRVMTENSPGWIIPAKPGLFIAKAVADSLQRTADRDFPAAVQRDLDAA